ncbi:serine/threonine-protein phosphatase 7 long form-like protein [Cucumis melo var. makuwa]|uniref:Serine/threonine-protein phosphatase 7 long form-like protein n=1 Tax=Cucumis melo var. makuwa TaxID=1194695 RepID=A0A5D3C527_CUCMM|nr:serine/threonine-protein phosphatase 7 long form-like protein [Cucumis melo var. makuwa]
MGYLIHHRVEFSEERGSISAHHPLRPAYCTILRGCWIPRGFLGWVHPIRLAFDYCSDRAAVGVASGWEPLTGLLRYNWKVIYEDFLGVLPPNMKGQWFSLPCLVE